MSPLDRVLRAPHSIAARRALAEEWASQQDERARLVELQIKRHEGLGPGNHKRVLKEIDSLLEQHARGWAGPIADLATWYEYSLGLISAVIVDGPTWVTRAHTLVDAAPIVWLGINPPLDLGSVARRPELEQIRLLSVLACDSVNDDAIEQFASSPHIRNLRGIELNEGRIGPRGMAALMRSPYLRDVIYITVTGNPGASTPGLVEVEGGKYILGTRGKELLGAAIDATAFGYSGQVEWPPAQSTFLFDNDG